MDLSRAIQQIYPTAQFWTDFEVSDNSDGNGPFISKWSVKMPDGTLAPEPTNAELQATWDALQAMPKPAARLPKILVIDRLQAAGLFATALATLKADDLSYERWSASNSVDPTNPEVIALLDAIGADKAVILAPE